MKNLFTVFIICTLLVFDYTANAKQLISRSYFDTISKRIEKIKTTIPIEYNQYVQSYINEYTDVNNNEISEQLSKAFFVLPDIEKQLKKKPYSCRIAISCICT